MVARGRKVLNLLALSHHLLKLLLLRRVVSLRWLLRGRWHRKCCWTLPAAGVLWWHLPLQVNLDLAQLARQRSLTFLTILQTQFALTAAIPAAFLVSLAASTFISLQDRLCRRILGDTTVLLVHELLQVKVEVEVCDLHFAPLSW